MPYDKEMKKGALAPPWDVTAYSGGRPRNLTGYTITIYIRYQNPVSGQLVVNAGSCTIVDAVNGQFQYQWASGDTDLVGLHFVEFWLTKDNKTIKIPEGRDDYLTLYISEDIGP